MDPTAVTSPCIDLTCELGECPLWHPEHERLYFTDITAGRIHFYEPNGGRHGVVYEGRPVGGLTLEADGSLLLFRDRGSIAVLKDGEVRPVLELEGLESTRFNDVIADPLGGVFAGTMSFGEGDNGRLYHIDASRKVALILEHESTPNGMAFSPLLDRFYYTDSRQRRIYVYDYAVAGGICSERHIWQEMSAEQVALHGRSDGMTVDQAGNVWSARIEAGLVIQYDSSGRELRRFSFPARRVTSVAFGGPDLSDLYVTSAGGASRSEEGSSAGALFCLKGVAQGKSEFRSRLGS